MLVSPNRIGSCSEPLKRTEELCPCRLSLFTQLSNQYVRPFAGLGGRPSTYPAFTSRCFRLIGNTELGNQTNTGRLADRPSGVWDSCERRYSASAEERAA